MNISSSLLLILAICLVAVFADQFQTSQEHVTSPPTDVYFPTCHAHDGCGEDDDDDDDCDRPLNANKRFPGVILLQGGSVDASAYTTIAAKIAAKGFIVAVPNAPITKTPPTNIPMQLSTPAIAVGAKTTLRTLSSTSTSGIYNRLQDEAWSIVGHSFGGVIAMITGARDAAQQFSPAGGPLRFLCFGYTGFGSEVKAVIGYGASLIDRGHGGPGVTLFNLNTTGVPTILIHGKNDGVNPLADDQTTYDALLEKPKALIELDYANHYGIADAQNIPGATPDPSSQTKSQDWSTTKIAKIIAVALDAHVNNKASALDKIYVSRSLGGHITVSASDL